LPFPRSPGRRVGSSFAACGTISAESWRNTRIQAPGKRAIFFSGNFGNWEVAARAVTQSAGLAVVEMYRAANNAIVDRHLSHSRRVMGSEFAAKTGPGRGACWRR
jgi:lauroyl/myristoyl acyltransferase